jgi:hypothetical protein
MMVPDGSITSTTSASALEAKGEAGTAPTSGSRPAVMALRMAAFIIGEENKAEYKGSESDFDQGI